MKTLHTRFGEVSYEADQILQFPEGLIGLDQLQRFLVMPNRKEGPLFWIQSVDDPDIAFILTDPTNFFLDYAVIPETSERSTLRIEEGDECFVLSVVTVPPDQKITVNLSAPILYAPKSNRAIQIILENTSYKPKTPLPAP